MKGNRISGPSGDDLDRLLESGDQQAIRRLVQELSDEAPSMAWRSSLNARLRAVAGADARRRLTWLVLRPALGFAAAAALTLAFIVKMPSGDASPTRPSASLETSLMDVHQEVSASIEVAGAGLTAYDLARQKASAPSDRDLWEEVDLYGL